MSQRLFVALFLAALAASSARAQGVRDSAYVQIDELARQRAEFRRSHAIGDFTGNKAPFTSLSALFERHEDPVLVALTDCFSDPRPTTVRYAGHALTRGGLCYLALHNLVYHEDDNVDWAGNYFGQLSRPRLLAAQRAWRQALRTRSYSPS